MNSSVKALLSWVKATIPTEGEDEIVNIEDLQNGEILLKLVYLLKKESIPCLSNCARDRFKIISDFIERDCRFNAINGTPIIWKAIEDGSNLTIEIAKVLLLLVYHDMMNDLCTLSTLDCNVESQIASLSATYVMESEGSVSLRPGLDAYLSTCLPAPRDVFVKSNTSSVSSLYDDDESPLFTRSQKVKFLDLQNVASSSASSSPIQDIMNTPIFQMRKLQRQLIQDRDYRDGLEKELSGKLSLLAQRESQISQLQYCLDKLKEDLGAGEQIAREQIDELEEKNNMLQSRFNDVLKQNKELKGNAALMERKVDEFAEENGVLSSQMRSVRSQLAIFEAEVSRLMETQTSNELEWKSTVSSLQSELNEARAHKELLKEQIEILQGKISCLEDKISRSTQEEEGDNMWISVEKEVLDNKICMLTDELENTTNSLQKIESEVQVKTQQLKECQQEISDQKGLLIQQQNQMDQLIESKKEAVENLQEEMTKMREVLQQEICALKLRLEEAEQQKHEQTTRLNTQVASCTQEIEKLKELKQQKENHLLQTEERVKELMAKLQTANNLLADKDQEVSRLTEKVVLLTEMHKQAKDESLAKEEMYSRLLLEKSQDKEVLQGNIESLKDQVNNLKSSVKQAEEELQVERELLSKTYQENGEQIDGLNHDIALYKETIETLKEEIQVKDDQITEVNKENMIQSERLQQEMCALKGQISSLCDSLSEAKQQVQTVQSELMKREKESSHQNVLLQQELSASEEMVKKLKVEIKTKVEQISLLENQSFEQSALLKRETSDLQQQVAALKSQLTKAEEDLHLKENDFALKQQQVEGLQTKVSQFEDEIKGLHANIQTREEELFHLKSETSTEMERVKENNLKRSEELENEIKHLNIQVQNVHETLNRTAEQLTLKEGMLARKEIEISNEKDLIQKLKATFDSEMLALKQQLNANEELIVTIKKEADYQSNLHQQEMQSLKGQLDNMAEALSQAEKTVQTQLQMISEQEIESAQQQESLQQKLSQSQAVIRKLENEISVKEQQIMELKTQSLEQSNVLHEHNENLQKRLESLASSLKDTQDKMHSKESLLTQQQQENQLQQEKLVVKEEQLLRHQLESAQQIDNLKKELVSLNAELNQHREMNTQALRQKEETLQSTQKERDTLIKEKETLGVRILAVEKQLEELQVERELLSKTCQENGEQIDGLNHDIVLYKETIETLKEEIQVKDDQITEVNRENMIQSERLQQEMCALKGQISSLCDSLSEAKQQVQTVQSELMKGEKESSHQNVLLQQELSASEEMVKKLKVEIKTKVEQISLLENQSFEQSALLKRETSDLQQQVVALKSQLTKAEEDLHLKENDFALKQQQVERLQTKVSQFEDEIKGLHANIQTREEELFHLKSETSTEMERVKENNLKRSEELENEIKHLNSRILAVEKQQEDTVLENHRLSQAKQAIERENDAALKLQTKLQQQLQMLKQDKDALLREREKENIEDIEVIKKDLLEQLSAKSTAVDHYKAQIDKAMDHYNSKKQLLQKSEEEVANLKHSLELQEREVKTATMTNNLLQMELEKVQSNEKLLLNKVASLEAQLSFADKALRTQNKFLYDQKEPPGEKYGINTRTKLRSMSSDSLDQSSLDDSLNNTRKLSAPGESSTPLVRRSERLAESLETLYFTPINTKPRNTTDSKPEESAKRNSASSVKRRRTTQVINITMTKKTPGRNEADETFYSLTSARSQPNLSSAHKAQGISTELFTTPKAAEADQLIGLPGYRRSTIHSQATSTFCVGAENEPEGGPEDWMRIAEIQARNKACLPHLKSAYPVEFDTVRNSALILTDEELRTGDPSETIRRASVMPGQLQESLASHRLSYMGLSGTATTSRSRLSLMPGQAIPKAVSSTLKSPKGGKRAPSSLTIHPTSPEKKIRASCFPRPLTPKNKNVGGPAIPHIQTTLSPADRRQSMMFTIDNTPRNKKDILKKGLNKLRSSTRKSPGKNLKSPAQSTSCRGQENIPARNCRTTAARQKKSPQVSTRAAKSPGLTASARKMMNKMKV